MGTVTYMSPEQVRGLPIDWRSDIWSLGVVLYEMLAGRTPFSGETMGDVIASILRTEAEPLTSFNDEIPAELECIVLKAMSKEREGRCQTAGELLSDLRQLKKHLEFSAEFERTLPLNKRGEAKIGNSIAVLPFANMSADAENEYFCDGLAEELLNALAKIEDLKVAARTSAFSFKGKNTNVSEIGRVLNVNSVLEGSVRKSGSRVRITVQLINASDGYHLWSERYDRELQDIFDVQDEITLAVVDALKVKLLGEEKVAVLKRYTDNPETYELYLKGLYHFNKFTDEGWRKAIEYFERTIEREPNYASAYVGIAFCQEKFWYYGFLPPHDAVPKWKVATRRALEIDDRLAEAHINQGDILFYYEWNWPEAEREYQRALELNPNSAEAHIYYGLFLASTDREDQAVGEGKRALELDPLSLLINLYVGFIGTRTDRADDALEQVRTMTEIESEFYGAYWLLGRVCLIKGTYEEAIRALQKALALRDVPLVFPPVLSTLGVAYGRSGKRDEAVAVLSQLLETRKQRHVPAINIARIYAVLGENDSMFEWLEKAYEERNGEMVYLGKREFWGKDVRDDPRFQDLLRRVGLPP